MKKQISETVITNDVNLKLFTKAEAKNKFKIVFESDELPLQTEKNPVIECIKNFLKTNLSHKIHKSINTMLGILDYLLTQKILMREGIFRKNSLKNRINEVLVKIHTGKSFSYNDFTGDELCNGIKTFIRVNMNGLISLQLYKTLMSIKSQETNDKTMLLLSCLVSTMNEEDAYFFISLLRVLGFIAKNSRYNRMDAYNLAVIFTPVFLGEKILSGITYDDINKFCLILESFIKLFNVDI